MAYLRQILVSSDITSEFCFPSEPTGEKLLSSHVADILLEDILPILHSFLHSYCLCINMKSHKRKWCDLGNWFLLSRPFPWGTPSNELHGSVLALCRAGVRASALFPCPSAEVSQWPWTQSDASQWAHYSGFSTSVATTENKEEEKEKAASMQWQEEGRSIVEEIITEILRLG